jgi:hypothetical protein|nr:MAG TPA: Protein of unknown function (DUF3102) [Caudoviricetes sp.]
MSEYIISQNCNGVSYAYFRGRFWRWDESAQTWKESHLLAQKFDKAKAVEKWLTPEAFLTSDEFIPMDDYALPDQMLTALRDAKPCKNAPIDPVEEDSSSGVPASCICSTCTCGGCKEECFGNCHSCGHPVQECNSYQTEGEKHLTPAHSADVDKPEVPGTQTAQDKPAAPSFDFGADDQTNALLLQDAQTFITGNMARIMAAKHAHDLTANHYKGSWGKWCAAVGISRDTGDNMVRVAEQFGNIQLEGKSIFDVQPMKLLYAAAKPSTPEEVKQAVFTGDITTYKEYQEALAQIKAEKDRANAAEAERDKLLGAQNRAAWAESHIQDVEAQRDAALADVQGLTEQNARLNAEKEKAVQSYNEMYESRIAANLQRQKAEAERDRAEARAHKAEDALKHQPITAVVDEEEVERRAAEKAWGLADARNRELQEENDRLKKNSAQLERRMKAMTSRMDDLGQTDFETANHCPEAMLAIWNSCKGSYSRLTGEDLENTFQYICNTLNSIRQEAALLCRQPEGYDGGAC